LDPAWNRKISMNNKET